MLGYDYEPEFFNGYSAILEQDALHALKGSRDVSYIIVDSQIRTANIVQQYVSAVDSCGDV